MNACLASAQIRQPLKQKLNIVSRKLDFARELQITFRDQSTNKQLNLAELKLRRARDLMQSRRRFFVQANQLINEAEILIDQSMRKLLKEPVRKRRENLENRIQKAEDIVRNSSNSEANNLLDKGIENKAIAEQAIRSG